MIFPAPTGAPGFCVLRAFFGTKEGERWALKNYFGTGGLSPSSVTGATKVPGSHASPRSGQTKQLLRRSCACCPALGRACTWSRIASLLVADPACYHHNTNHLLTSVSRTPNFESSSFLTLGLRFARCVGTDRGTTNVTTPNLLMAVRYRE
jgi:hypothetical protein